MYSTSSTILLLLLFIANIDKTEGEDMSFDASGNKFPFDAMESSDGPGSLIKPGEPMLVERHMLVGDGDEDSSQFSMSPREQHDQETDMCLRMFENWTLGRQTEFVEQLIARMSFHQHEHIYSILMPMLQRDFITVLPSMLENPFPVFIDSHKQHHY